VTMSLSQWARAQNISVGTLHGRLSKGWAVERALTKPSPSRVG